MMAQLGTQRGQKAQCGSNVEKWDRFYVLPDPIVHHIFSFLDMDDIVRIGAVSKKFRELSISSPYLKLRSNCSKDGPPNLCKQFADHVDRLLNQRNGFEIRCLCLHWACHHYDWDSDKNVCDVDVNLIDKWINVAVSCRVQEIDLEVGIHDSLFFELPHCVFNSETLRVLKLDLQYKFLKEPAGVLSALEELSLYRYEGSDSQNVIEKLISMACPALKRLTLAAVRQLRTLNIHSSCLKELTLFGLPSNLRHLEISTDRLQKLSLDLNPLHPRYRCEMKINAPFLEELKWTASTANNVHLSQFEFLKNATLSVGTFIGYVPKVVICNRMTQLLLAVRFARVLHLNSDVLETQFLHDRLSIMFENLQRLHIKVNGGLKPSQFPVFASVLMRSPNLEKLSLRCGQIWYQPDYAQKLKFKAFKFLKEHEGIGFHYLMCPKLKAMKIDLEGKDHQLVVLQNMLKIARGLEKLTIIYAKENSKALSKIDLHKYRIVSQPLKVKLVEKEFHTEDMLRQTLNDNTILP